jgi:GxxExxY protein
VEPEHLNDLSYRIIEAGIEIHRALGKDIVLDAGYRVDLIVADTIIVELKPIETVLPVHYQQVLTYLKHANKPLGLLINFNVAVLTSGVKRIKNGF